MPERRDFLRNQVRDIDLHLVLARWDVLAEIERRESRDASPTESDRLVERRFALQDLLPCRIGDGEPQFEHASGRPRRSGRRRWCIGRRPDRPRRTRTTCVRDRASRATPARRGFRAWPRRYDGVEVTASAMAIRARMTMELQRYSRSNTGGVTSLLLAAVLESGAAIAQQVERLELPFQVLHRPARRASPRPGRATAPRTSRAPAAATCGRSRPTSACRAACSDWPPSRWTASRGSRCEARAPRERWGSRRRVPSTSGRESIAASRQRSRPRTASRELAASTASCWGPAFRARW